MDPIEELLARLTASSAWPPPAEKAALRLVDRWRAFLDGDAERLRELVDWPEARPYKVDGLPALMADSWADHLFGEDPVFVAGDEADEDRLAELLDGNDELVEDLHAAERIVVGEGEAWWRVYVDRDLAAVPLLEWHSRDVVFPFILGGRLLACALLTEYEDGPAVFRHFECHADGIVEHHVFRGAKGVLGSEVDLDSVPELEELALELDDAGAWRHGLPMLMGRIANRRAPRRRGVPDLGVSDFARSQDYLLDLNEAATIAAENARLTAKKRAVVPESSVRAKGALPTGDVIDRGDGLLVPAAQAHAFDAGEDVFVVNELDSELGGNRPSPFTVLEYSYDAEALIAHKRDLVESALTRVGLTPMYVGVATGEPVGVLSGTAYKLKLTPTTKGGKGKRRPWDRTLPHVLRLMALVAELTEEEGGFGMDWTDPDAAPAVEWANALPSDEVEEATVEATLVGAGVRSIRTSVQAQHPDWTDEQIDEEVERIRGDRQASRPFA